MHIRINRLLTILAFLAIVVSQFACGLGSEEEPTIEEITPTEIEQQAGPVETQEPIEPTVEPEEPTVEPTLVEETPEDASIAELPSEIMDYYSGTPVSYLTIDDFEESWAQIGWYQYWTIEDSPTNFVIRTNATWSSASDTANWNQSGCGFVFHVTDEKNHYIAYLGLDGNVYVQRMVQGEAKLVGSGYYDTVDVPEGSADLMLMVLGDKIYFFVDGSQVYKGIDSILTGKLKSGDLALTLVSGTNKGYGTRCQMTGIELWDLGEP
jgi:hypothetical protein